jgi:OOP family OmpA-OmpF porin
MAMTGFCQTRAVDPLSFVRRGHRILGMLAVRLLVAAALGALWACGAAAQASAPENGWYLGGGIRPALPQIEDTDIGYRHFGGYRFSRRWGVELGYSDLGRGSEGEHGLFEAQKLGAQTSAWTLAGTGVLPLGNAFSIQGRLGVSLTTPDATLMAPGSGIGSAFPRHRPTVLWGFGGQYDLTGSVGLRVDYNNFGRLTDDPNGTRSDLWSINAVVRF